MIYKDEILDSAQRIINMDKKHQSIVDNKDLVKRVIIKLHTKPSTKKTKLIMGLLRKNDMLLKGDR